MTTLYEDVKNAGLTFSNHESDLYVQDSPAVRELLKKHGLHGVSAVKFVNQAPPHKGELWWDIPFAYIPWWEARAPKH